MLQHGAVVAQVLGGTVEFPSLDDQLAELDAFLAAEPEVRDPHDQELRDALGLRGGR